MSRKKQQPEPKVTFIYPDGKSEEECREIICEKLQDIIVNKMIKEFHKL